MITGFPKRSKFNRSPYAAVWGFFIVASFLVFTGCAKEPEEVLQQLEDGTIMRRHYEIAGKKEGLMTDYYPDGKIKGERNFVNDRQHGRAVWYYPDGGKKESQLFEHGFQIGVDSLWMESGALQRTINFRQGKKEGLMRAWSEDGELILEVIFAQDSLLKVNKSPNKDSIPAGQNDQRLPSE